MAIVDRSFCNFTDMANWKYGGGFADFLFKVGSCGWQIQNDYNFVKPWDGKRFAAP